MPISLPTQPSIIRPSYRDGFARNAGESAYPELWEGLTAAWVPGLGVGHNARLRSLIRTTTAFDPDLLFQSMTMSAYVAAGHSDLGSALDFNGSSNWMRTDNTVTMANFVTATTASMMVWYRPVGTAPTIASAYLGQALINESAGYIGLLRGIISSTDAVWAYNYDGNADEIAIPYTVGQWGLFGMVHSLGNLHAYGNAIYYGSIASGNTSVLTGVPWVGDNNFNANYLAGRIAAIYVYNRALTARDFATEYSHPLAPFRLRRRTFVVVPGAAGDQTITVSDTGSGADALGLIASFALSDTGSGAETLAPTVSFALSDVGSGADTLALAQILAALTDTGAGSDTLALPQITATLGDTGSGAETLDLSANFTMSDTGSGTDTPTPGASVPLSDTGSGTDALTLAQILAALSDTGTGTDSPGPVSASFALSDTGSGADSVVVDTGAIIRTIAETATGADALALSVSLAVTDTGTGAETITITATIVIDESAQGAEVVDVLTAQLITVTDSAASSDAVTVQPATITLTETGDGTEQIGITLALTIADTASGVDSALVSRLIAIAETASATVESVSISVQVPQLEQATIADAIAQVLASLAVTDAATGAETIIRITPGVIASMTFTSEQRTMTFTFEDQSMTFTIEGGS